MKKTVFVFIFGLVSFISNAQTEMIKEVFRLLPADKIYDLTVATRDSMLAGKTYYPATNDSAEIMAYNHGISTNVEDYMFVSMSFETEQRGDGLVEIRGFKMINGDHLILVSQIGGVWNVTYHQHQLSTYIYRKDKKLIPYNKKILSATDESAFMKPGIPDSIRKKILTNSNMTFNLSLEKLMLELNSFYNVYEDPVKKWLKGDTVFFDWIKDKFVMGKMEFQF